MISRWLTDTLQFVLIPAWLASLVLSALAILAAEKYGADRHVYDVRLALFEPLTRSGWIAEIIFLVATGCTKVSVLLFYRRLVEGTYSRTWKYATIAAIIFTTAYCVAFFFVLIFNCSPTDAYWRSYSESKSRENMAVWLQGLSENDHPADTSLWHTQLVMLF